jgi:hypothetical protein
LTRTLPAENRTIDGTFNHLTNTDQGAANKAIIRHGYDAEFADTEGAMITEPARPNARGISNAVFAQSASRKNSRGLSDCAWAFGQFLAHDMDLITSSHGAATNGTAPIAVYCASRAATVESADSLGRCPSHLSPSNTGRPRIAAR